MDISPVWATQEKCRGPLPVEGTAPSAALVPDSHERDPRGRKGPLVKVGVTIRDELVSTRGHDTRPRLLVPGEKVVERTGQSWFGPGREG